MCVCVLLHRGGVVNQSLRAQEPGGMGLSSEESQACLAPGELLGIFHGSSLVFHRKHAH